MALESWHREGTMKIQSTTCSRKPHWLVSATLTALALGVGAILCPPVATASPSSGVAGAVLIVHADPDDGPGAIEFNRWPKLIAFMEFINSADSGDHAVLIEMGAGWGDFITGRADRLDTVADWVSAGHQIGFHHHDCSHLEADGYHDFGWAYDAGVTPDEAASPESNCMLNIAEGDHKGPVADAWAEVYQIHQSLHDPFGINLPPTMYSAINTAAQGHEYHRALDFVSVEWQPQAYFQTGAVTDNQGVAGSSLSRLTCQSYLTASAASKSIGHNMMAVGDFATNDDTMTVGQLHADLHKLNNGDCDSYPVSCESESDPTSLPDVTGDDYVGLVVHAVNFDPDKYSHGNPYLSDVQYVKALIGVLDAHQVVAELPSVIMNSHGCTGTN